jgi:hypothetical protein
VVAHESSHAQGDGVGTGLQAGWIHTQGGEDFGPYSDTEFLVLASFDFIDRLAVVVIRHKQDGGVKGHGVAGRLGCWLGMASGCGGQGIKAGGATGDLFSNGVIFLSRKGDFLNLLFQKISHILVRI